MSLLVFSISQARLPLLPEKYGARIESAFESMADFFGLEEIAGQPMSPDNEALIRSALDKLGIKRKVCIRRFSNFALFGMGWGQRNAMTNDLGGVILMLFDEEYFNTLSQEQKTFIALHEGAHALRFHKPLKLGVQFLLVNPLVNLINTNFFQWKLNKRCLVVTGLLLFDLFFSRLCEFDADIAAARVLNEGKNGASLWEHRDLEEQVPESRFFLKRILSHLAFKIILPFFNTHPTNEQRADVLKRFDENPSASLPKLLCRHYIDWLQQCLRSIRGACRWSTTNPEAVPQDMQTTLT